MSSCPPWLFVALVQHLPTSIRSTWPPRVEDVASRAGACEAVAVAGAGPASTGPATRPATRPVTEDSPAAELAAGRRRARRARPHTPRGLRPRAGPRRLPRRTEGSEWASVDVTSGPPRRERGPVGRLSGEMEAAHRV